RSANQSFTDFRESGLRPAFCWVLFRQKKRAPNEAPFRSAMCFLCSVLADGLQANGPLVELVQQTRCALHDRLAWGKRALTDELRELRNRYGLRQCMHVQV